MSSSSREPPPAGPPWDTPFGEAPLAFVDLEMTGLDAARDRVIEICIDRVVGGHAVDRLASYLRPEPLGEQVGNQHVHGITAEVLAAAPSFADLADRVLGLLSGAVLVGHGARWDLAFLQAELRAIGRTFSCEHYFDTLALSRRLIEAPTHRLAALAVQLGIDNPTPHRADNDVRVTRALWDHLISKLPARPTTPRTIWEQCVGRAPVRPGILAAVERAAATGQLAEVCYRAGGRSQRLQFHVTGVRTDLDPPVVLGYLHLTRGRRELRADRILSLELIST